GVRGQGLLAAIELCPGSADEGIFVSFLSNHGLYAYAVAAALAEETGVLMLPTLGEAPVLRLAPPLVIGGEEINFVLDALEYLCSRLEGNATRTLAQAVRAVEPFPTVDCRSQNGKNSSEQSAIGRPVYLPPPVCRANGRPRYAFLTHPTRLEDLALTNPGLEQLGPRELRRFGDFLADLPPLVVMQAPRVESSRSVAE